MNQTTDMPSKLFGWYRLTALIASLVLIACTMKPAMLTIEGLEKPLAAGQIVDSASSRVITFDQLIRELDKVRVIYIGERHTSIEHHRIQLQIIRALSEQGKQITVGMEMFDHTYQQRLDKWTAGELQWADFLKQVHWYANWKFDDTLYQEILEFIKAQNIPLVGLNIPFHLPAKIAVGGLENLSKQDRNLLSAHIDVTDSDHRNYVEEIFKMHKMRGREDFDNFYAAQCAWEDGMAQAIADNLSDSAFVVIAGNGHIVRKFGIPNRAFVRTGVPFRTIYLATPNSEVVLTDGDFIWVTPADPPIRQRPH